MHEMGMALEIIDIAVASIPDDLKQNKVKKINIKIGKLSTIVPESLKFCFDIASKGTQVYGTELSLEVIPIMVECQECNIKRVIDEPIFICANCGSGSLKVLSGRELDIYSIEIEEKE